MSVLLEAIACHIFESKKKKKKAAEASLDQQAAAARSSFLTFSVATALIPLGQSRISGWLIQRRF
jgi:hypothetical protein